MTTLDELLAAFKNMPEEAKAEIDANNAALGHDLLWTPSPGPQTDAYFSLADELLYGGAAGGGKTDLLIGLGINEHERCVIYRRQSSDLSWIIERSVSVFGTRNGYSQPHGWRRGKFVMEFAHLDKPGSEEKQQGRPRDYIGIDEAAQIDKNKLMFVMGWLRGAAGQRKRIVLASNPPLTGDGEYIITWFAPWVDPLFANPAKPGELRWFVNDDEGDPLWVKGPGKYRLPNGKVSDAISRTFVPALLSDNPYLRGTGYQARVENLPEPMRTALLTGSFMAARQDHAWQVIPSAWIAAAQRRWKPEGRQGRMLSMGVDVAQGGKANTCVSRLHDPAWFDELVVTPGVDTTDGPTVSAVVIPHQRNSAPISIDMTGGWGGAAKLHMEQAEMDVVGVVYSSGSGAVTKDGAYGFFNLRAEMLWKLREALDPTAVIPVALPPDTRLAAQLAAGRWKPVGDKIQIEPKADIELRVGSTLDRSDAVMQAWNIRERGLIKAASTGGGRYPAHWGKVEAVDDPYAEL